MAFTVDLRIGSQHVAKVFGIHVCVVFLRAFLTNFMQTARFRGGKRGRVLDIHHPQEEDEGISEEEDIYETSRSGSHETSNSLECQHDIEAPVSDQTGNPYKKDQVLHPTGLW